MEGWEVIPYPGPRRRGIPAPHAYFMSYNVRVIIRIGITLPRTP